jgi:hypothetical protein
VGAVRGYPDGGAIERLETGEDGGLVSEALLADKLQCRVGSGIGRRADEPQGGLVCAAEKVVEA